MEAWLAELQKLDPDPLLISQHFFDESVAAELTKDFVNPRSSQSNTSNSHQENVNDKVIELFASPPYAGGTYNIKNLTSSNFQQKNEIETMQGEHNSTEQAAIKNAKKRIRAPSQVQDHIIAERKRREVISERFIALSAIVPGLKKIDKTSILGESIKYMKQLQEKVKVLEEEAAKRTVESMVMVKKSQLIIDDDDDSYSNIDKDSTCSSDGGNVGNHNDSLPQVKINISNKILFVRVYCLKQKGLLSKLFAEIEKHELSVVNCSILPFKSLTLDITIVAQMKKGFKTIVKDLVEDIYIALSLANN